MRGRKERDVGGAGAISRHQRRREHWGSEKTHGRGKEVVEVSELEACLASSTRSVGEFGGFVGNPMLHRRHAS